MSGMTTEKKRGRRPSKELFSDGTYDLDEFHKTFIELEDLTEYKPAMKLLGDWQEWERLKRDSKWFESHVILWKEELKIKLKSDAMQKIIELSKDTTATAGTAAKWLAESTWDKESGRGRVSKAEQRRQANVVARAAAETAAERERILKVMDGGKV